jgi:hypothetical protein
VSQTGLGQWGGQPPSHKTNPRPSLSHGGVQHQRYLPALLATLNATPVRVRAVELRHQHGCPAGLACRCKPHFAIVTDEAREREPRIRAWRAEARP